MDTTAILKTAFAHFQRREYDQAEALYTRAFHSNERQSEALYGLAVTHMARGNAQQGEAFLRQSLQLVRRNPIGLTLLGQALLRRGERDEAVRLLGEALAYDPANARALEALATLSPNVSANAGSAPAPRAASAGAAPIAPAPSASSASSTPPRPPRRPTSPKNSVGIVQDLTKQIVPWCGQPAGLVVWTCRLQMYDPSGKPYPLVGIELRGHEISGALSSGDWVELRGLPKNGDGFKPKEMLNLTTGQMVRRRWFIFAP